MRIITALACVVALGLLAGCGSSDTKTVTTTASTPTTTTPPATTTPPTTTTPTGTDMQGPVGTMGPPPQNTKYDATDPTVLSHIEAALKDYVATKGIKNAQVKCTGVTPSQAKCQVTNPANGKSVTATVAVNQTTGKLRIVDVT